MFIRVFLVGLVGAVALGTAIHERDTVESVSVATTTRAEVADCATARPECHISVMTSVGRVVLMANRGSTIPAGSPVRVETRAQTGMWATPLSMY